MSRKNLLLASILLLTGEFLYGQSFEQTLNRYNKVAAQLDEFKKKDNLLDTSVNFDELISETQNIIRTFQNLNGIKDDYRLASGYYAVLSFQKLAEIYDATLDFENAYATLKKISPYINGSTVIPLPIYFKLSGSQYQITSDNMLALKNQYYDLMQYLTYYMSKYDELKQVVNAQIQLNNDSKSIVIGLTYLLELDKNTTITLTADEKIFYYSSFLLSYSRLTDKELTGYSNNKLNFSWIKIATDLLAITKTATVSNNNTTNIAKALTAISSKNRHSEALLDLFQYTFSNYFQTTDYQGNIYAFNTSNDPYSYYETAEKMATNAIADTKLNDSYLNTAMNILTAAEKEKAKKLALAALTKMGDYAVSKNLCDKIQQTAEKLNKWGFTTEYAKYNALVLPCQVAVKKENERKARELKRANSKTNIYLGAYPLGLITKPDKMDFGAVLNFVTAGKGALELSFLKINQKRDNYFDIWMMEKKYKAEDLSLWDGYYAHVQYKFFNNRNNSGIYNGILLGYSDKDFAPMTVKTTDITTNAEKDELFDPTLRQTILMINEGYMGLYKGVGFDVFIGVGATYNRYNSGNTTYNSSTHNIVDNNVLQFRKKEYFSFIMRFGVTVGLNIGNGNRK